MGRLVILFIVVMFGLGAARAGEPVVEVDGVAFGAPRRFTGVYVSNFEISKFTECAAREGACEGGELEGLYCQPVACADLTARARRIGWNLKDYGQVRITFIGRRSLHRAPPRHMHDTESKVLVERMLSLERLPTSAGR